MADIYTKRKRSAVMSRIRSAGNRDTELRLVAILRAHHITGWRRKSKLPGKPDFVFPAQRLALFVDGCYWHGCPKHYRRPKTHRAFWDAKIVNNRRRDREVNRLLRAKGWRVLRVWEHALARKHETRATARIRHALQQSPRKSTAAEIASQIARATPAAVQPILDTLETLARIHPGDQKGTYLK